MSRIENDEWMSDEDKQVLARHLEQFNIPRLKRRLAQIVFCPVCPEKEAPALWVTILPHVEIITEQMRQDAVRVAQKLGVPFWDPEVAHAPDMTCPRCGWKHAARERRRWP